MCGIYGGAFLGLPSSKELGFFEKLGDLLHHRGPDEAGEYTGESILLGNRRLSIVGVENGNQPIWNFDKSVCIVANGEIYNHQEVRDFLHDKGYYFKTKSDIECLLHLYLEYGNDFLIHARGMFAFAIYDKRTRKLLLGRDRLGEKPLFYTESANGIWFSSEASALIKSGIRPFKISSKGLSMYLKYGFVPPFTSLFDGVGQISPGTIMNIDLDSLHRSTQVYWSLEDFRSAKDTDLKDEYRNELSVISRSIFQSEVPVGLALSGGLDSSLIAFLAKKNNTDLHTITIGYNTNKDIDESAKAQKLSHSLGFECTVRNISPDEVGNRFVELVSTMDEPIADPNSFGYYILGEEARRIGLKVLLSGHGPDELFWGYEWVRQLFLLMPRRVKTFSENSKIMDYLRNPRFRYSTKGALLFGIKSGFGVVEGILQFFEDRLDSRKSKFTILLYSRKPEFRKISKICRNIGIDLMNTVDEMENFTKSEIPRSQKVLREILINTYLQVNGLAQIDRLWMANSIEGRSLFLDYRLVEIALRDQANRPKNNHLSKSQFKKYVQDLVPPEMILRKKRGFTPPVKEWFMSIYKENAHLLNSSKLVSDGILGTSATAIMRRPLTILRRPRLLWLELVTLEIWYRQFD